MIQLSYGDARSFSGAPNRFIADRNFPLLPDEEVSVNALRKIFSTLAFAVQAMGHESCSGGDDRKGIGARGEDAAVRLLVKAGCRIVCRNWRSAIGEIDIICVDGAELVFVEVKSRRGYSRRSFTRLFDNVTQAKQAKLRKLAELYLLKHRLFGYYRRVRIDVVGVLFEPKTLEVKQMRHLKGAV